MVANCTKRHILAYIKMPLDFKFCKKVSLPLGFQKIIKENIQRYLSHENTLLFLPTINVFYIVPKNDKNVKFLFPNHPKITINY